MSKAIFLTGTGTDIGKTFIAGLIVKKLAQAGKNPAYYKAAMSGNDRRSDESLIPGDALFVKEMSGISQSLDDMCPYVYENAWSPHLASRVEGNPVDLLNPPEGCAFAPRCKNCMKICLRENPPKTDFSETHYAHCFMNQKAEMEGGNTNE